MISVKLKAAVVVLSDYPIRPPLFTLAVLDGGSYIRNDYVRVCTVQEMHSVSL